jgi:hypothetical protein
MKLATALVALGATHAAAGVFGSNQQPLGGITPKENEVPGENPLEFCEDPKDYLLDITKVDLEPNPPLAYVFKHLANPLANEIQWRDAYHQSDG